MSHISSTPDHFDELISEGAAALQVGNHQQAIDVWAQAALIIPASGVPHFLIGSALASQEEYEKAETAFSNAVLLSPNFSIARYQLGLLQFTSGRAALALVMWQPLLEIASPTAEEQALSLFVRGYAALAQDDFGPALAQFREGVRINSGNAVVSSDVNKVIDRVEKLLASTGITPTTPVPDEIVDLNDAHVLLNNYQNIGRSH